MRNGSQQNVNVEYLIGAKVISTTNHCIWEEPYLMTSADEIELAREEAFREAHGTGTIPLVGRQ